jgi:hypothetical protein
LILSRGLVCNAFGFQLLGLSGFLEIPILEPKEKLFKFKGKYLKERIWAL